jgi:hypothetical protein
MVLLASDFDQSKYLKAADLPHEKKFRIKHVTEEQIGPDKERKLVVWFTNDQRGLVLNLTNNRAIRGAYGDSTDGWVGKIVVIFSTMADFRGKMTPALRCAFHRQSRPRSSSATPPHPVTPGRAAAAAAADPELKPDPAKPLRDELDDEIPW